MSDEPDRVRIIAWAICGGVVGLIGGGVVAARLDAMGAALIVVFIVTPACAILSGVLAARIDRNTP